MSGYSSLYLYLYRYRQPIPIYPIYPRMKATDNYKHIMTGSTSNDQKPLDLKTFMVNKNII
jgi:hypothetical protein